MGFQGHVQHQSLCHNFPFSLNSLHTGLLENCVTWRNVPHSNSLKFANFVKRTGSGMCIISLSFCFYMYTRTGYIFAARPEERMTLSTLQLEFL